MIADRPSFATFIKGARIRFRWVNHKGCFIRMSPVSIGVTRIELEPPNADFSETRMSKKSKTEHYIWWQNGDNYDDFSILETIPCLRNLKAIKRPVCFDVDDNGNRI